ncbi:GNAT family N-acetyltransferase [Parasphingopyxis algicola]|uniref:GNAT family N-acetyltransferase n=1 Tax=Parasphingopyxis algicola TaxID=2026624 RepID=UPI0015A3CA0E|nr:GNAT family N-acetyltransferase [Parasphingopyxis algicola]QLC25185.1 GNAT family N-acetyltransferase [Parasphingopyxis algicola]
MADYEYHLVTEANAMLLDAVEKRVFEAPVRADFLSTCLANPNQFLIVAEAEGRVIGKALAYIFHFPDKPSEIYVEEIDVAKDWRRKGIATGLMDAVGAEGRKRGIAEYWLITEKDNDRARSLYEQKAHRRQKSIWYEFYC